MERAAAFIRNRCSSDIRVADIADYLCVDRKDLRRRMKILVDACLENAL